MQRRFRKLCQPPAAIVAMGCVLLAGAACTADADESPPQVTLPTPERLDLSAVEGRNGEALGAYAAMERAMLDIMRDGGSDETADDAIALTTPEGSARRTVQDVVEASKEQGPSSIEGEIEVIGYRILGQTSASIQLSVCWDARALVVDGEQVHESHRILPTMELHGNQWLVAEYDAEVVEECAD